MAKKRVKDLKPGDTILHMGRGFTVETMVPKGTTIIITSTDRRVLALHEDDKFKII